MVEGTDQVKLPSLAMPEAMMMPELAVEVSPCCRRRVTVVPLSAFQLRVVDSPAVKT